MLFTTKAITRLGKRADGTTVSDFDDEEKKRQPLGAARENCAVGRLFDEPIGSARVMPQGG